MATKSDQGMEENAIGLLKSLGCTNPEWQQRFKGEAIEFIVKEINNQKEKMKQRYRKNLITCKQFLSFCGKFCVGEYD